MKATIWNEVSVEVMEPMNDIDTNGPANSLFLDELLVGQRFVSGSHAVSAEEIKAFERQFDPQPFHLDESAAKGTMFDGLVASGWHTAAITMRLNLQGGLPIAGGIIGAGGEINWPNPLRPGDVVRVESEVLKIVPSRSRADRGVVTIASRTLNQSGEVVQILKARVVVFRKAS